MQHARMRGTRLSTRGSTLAPRRRIRLRPTRRARTTTVFRSSAAPASFANSTARPSPRTSGTSGTSSSSASSSLPASATCRPSSRRSTPTATETSPARRSSAPYATSASPTRRSLLPLPALPPPRRLHFLLPRFSSFPESPSLSSPVLPTSKIWACRGRGSLLVGKAVAGGGRALHLSSSTAEGAFKRALASNSMTEACQCSIITTSALTPAPLAQPPTVLCGRRSWTPSSRAPTLRARARSGMRSSAPASATSTSSMTRAEGGPGSGARRGTRGGGPGGDARNGHGRSPSSCAFSTAFLPASGSYMCCGEKLA
jgi:hypothetical protein